MAMRRTNKAMALAAGIAALIALNTALAGGAVASAGDFELARFRVEIEGSSKTVWRSTIEAETECDSSDHSSGSERLAFSTKKPFVVTATHMQGDFNPRIFAGRSALGVPVEARVMRRYTPDVVLPAKSCEDNGGGAEPVRPDCGGRRVPTWHVQLEFSEEKRNGLQLHGDSGAKTLYESCPAALYCYPFLLDEENGRGETPLYADLSPDEIFDPKLQRWITIGNGSFEDRDANLWSRTRVHWTVSFTRLKEKGVAAPAP